MGILRVSLIALLTSSLACGANVSDDDFEPGPDQEDPPDESDPPSDPPPSDPPPPAPTIIFVHTNNDLYVVDDQSFDLVHVGAFDIADEITDIAVTPDGRLFGISFSSLYEIDTADGQATFIAPVPGVLNVGLTFLPNGQLLATDKDGGVREVSPDTGAVTEIGKFGNGWGTAGDLVAVADGTMFAIGEEPDAGSGDPNVLLTVDTQLGDAAYVGSLGYSNVFGAAYAGGKVYAFSDDGRIVRVDPVTGSGTLVRTHPVSFWGAAVTPLVAVE